MGVKLIPQIEPWQRELGKMLSGALAGEAGGMLSGIMEGESFDDISKAWSEGYAKPVMAAWQRDIAPIISEGFNLPGAFYSRDRSRGLQREAEEFFSGSVAPSLFSSMSQFQARKPQWAGIWSNVLANALGLSTAPTQSGLYSGKGWQQDFASLSQGLGNLFSVGITKEF